MIVAIVVVAVLFICTILAVYKSQNGDPEAELQAKQSKYGMPERTQSFRASRYVPDGPTDRPMHMGTADLKEVETAKKTLLAEKKVELQNISGEKSDKEAETGRALNGEPNDIENKLPENFSGSKSMGGVNFEPEMARVKSALE